MEAMAMWMPAAMTVMGSMAGMASNNAQYASQLTSAQNGVAIAGWMNQQESINALQEEAAGQRANADVVRQGTYLASKFDAGAAASGTFGPDLALNRARIVAEAAYQGQQKQWGYEQAARVARLQGAADVAVAESKLSSVQSGSGSVGMANVGILAQAGGSLFSKYGSSLFSAGGA